MDFDLNEEEILNNFWFLDRDADLRVSLMAFGLEVGKGWLPLINELCYNLAELIEKKYPEFREEFRVLQVKEKFGILCFYVNFGNDEIFDLIDDYQDKSARICEYCGNTGELRNRNYWYATLCDECNTDWQNGAHLWTLG